MSTLVNPDGTPIMGDNGKRIISMFEHSLKMFELAKEGKSIECTVIFFDRNDVARTLRAGTCCSVGGILETVNMLITRAQVPEVHAEKIREELAMWALGRMQGLEQAEAAASALVDLEKSGVQAPLMQVVDREKEGEDVVR